FTRDNMSKPPSSRSFGGRLVLSLESKPCSIAQVQSFVQEVMPRFNINDDTFGNILVSLTEAVNNAMIHGNRRDANKRVNVSVERRVETVAVKVSDEGKGFDYDSLPDPTAPENIECCGGRGVFLMRALSDDIRYSDNGSTVEMRFRV
ncbi:MAG: ATP-binding protein, partial [Bacteroidota bacterium]